MSIVDLVVGFLGLICLIPIGVVMLVFALVHVARNLITTGRCWQ